MEADATVAGERGSGDRLDELDRRAATVAVDRVDVRLHHTVGSEQRDDGVDRCPPCDPQGDLELLHRRVQVRHDETDVKERVVDGRRQRGSPIRTLCPLLSRTYGHSVRLSSRLLPWAPPPPPSRYEPTRSATTTPYSQPARPSSLASASTLPSRTSPERPASAGARCIATSRRGLTSSRRSCRNASISWTRKPASFWTHPMPGKRCRSGFASSIRARPNTQA